MIRNGRRLTTLAFAVAGFAALAMQPHPASAKKVDPGTNPIIQTLARLDTTKTTSATVDGSVGGVLYASKWLLLVPPGSFHGTGVITMKISGATGQVVDLSISPASLNNFSKPVFLKYTKTQSAEDIANESIYWWDPATATWVPAPAQTGDPLQGWIQSGLVHFSTYAIRGGRAGW